MFIANGKSLFGNTGLIISLLILIILVYFSYNKCYVNNIDGFANCADPKTTDPQCLSPPPKSVRIKVSGSTVTINFSIDMVNKVPKGFIIVLAQYDSTKNNTGNNKFYLSNETILNPSSTVKSDLQSSEYEDSKPQSSLCNIVNGKPVCKYVFSNLDVRDLSGNLYYYKLGVSALYDGNMNSVYVTPYNISNRYKFFTLNESLDNQNLKGDKCSKPPISANIYDTTMSTADGQYELIKSQLGNYPDNFFIESQSTTNGMLTDLVDKSMAQALINIDVSVPTLNTS